MGSFAAEQKSVSQAISFIGAVVEITVGGGGVSGRTDGVSQADSRGLAKKVRGSQDAEESWCSRSTSCGPGSVWPGDTKMNGTSLRILKEQISERDN